MVFGVAGVPTNYKGKFAGVFPWLKAMGLNGFEIQCTYGFKVGDDRKEIIKAMSKDGFSLHKFRQFK